ncbi:MAG: alpha/beta hydrolase [Lysobacter sp.]|nr:alpha/beta hydrolase [Lysobacter sp.]
MLVPLLACGAIVHAQGCPDTAPYAKAREVIGDLDRITSPDGIQESYSVRIGGVSQWISVRGQDRANPILLFVHGGPASPAMPTLWQFQRPLEEYFTVVQWDQRAAGKSLAGTGPASLDSLHIDRYVEDTIEVADLTRRRYGKGKVILAGHSWGTVVAMRAALKRPDLFHAYVGIGQVIDMRENERISYDHGVEEARAHHNAAALKELATIAPYPGDAPITRERIVIARKWAQYYGGLSAFRSDSKYYFDGPLLSPDYDAADVCAIDKGNLATLGRILPEFLAVDFRGVKRFPIPVVMFLGRHDYTTPSAPTAEWLARVDAPYKRAVWFEHSAHMIPWEEPGKTLISLLQTVRPLATGAQPASTR